MIRVAYFRVEPYGPIYVEAEDEEEAKAKAREEYDFELQEVEGVE